MTQTVSLPVLTSELQTPKLEGDQAIANLNDVHQSVEVV